ncbi:MAG TPA: YARHG domain-containing protein [Chitinophagaceae bacterium]|nr:YARHG domain-containing protein [Chitinophagaceae bacterium]
MPLLLIFVMALFLSNSTAFAQIPKHLFNEVSGEVYDAKDFSSGTKPIKDRIGNYHFGESEGEWNFVILQNKDSLIVQLWDGRWDKDYFIGETTWLNICHTFNKVKLEGNKISFGKYSGQFADAKDGNKSHKALLLFCDPLMGRNYGKDSAEVGYYSSETKVFYSDKEYSELSLSVKPESYFAGKSKQQLKIMRNAIYARYGMIFQAGGDMEKYFRKKEWYRPFQKNVAACLTDIENRNIETISRLEQL